MPAIVKQEAILAWFRRLVGKKLDSSRSPTGEVKSRQRLGGLFELHYGDGA